MFVKRIFAMAALISAAGAFANAPAPTQKQVGAYFTQWSIYARNYFVKDIAVSKSASKLTFLDYAFGNIKPANGGYECASLDAWADYGVKFGGTTGLPSVDGSIDDANGVQAIAGNFNQLKKLKAQNPNLKVLISLGGWTGSKYFSVAAATAASRQQLVSSCINLFIKGNLPAYQAYPTVLRGGASSAAGIFDGIDIDWETPGLDIQGNGTTHSASDRTNFTLLLQEFRTQLDALQATSSQEYLLTAAVLTGDDHVIQTDPASYSTYLNWVNVMAYDYQGAWAATGPTSHHSQLLTAGAPRNDPYNTAGFDKRTVVTALSRIPANKIVMGIPFYARGWTGVNVSNSAPGLLGLYAPATGAAPGTYEPGIEDYKKIRKLRGVETYDSDVVATSKVIYPTYYFMYSAQNNPTWVSATFWSYDSPRSIQDKIAYIKQRNYAGIYGWSIDGDTADGELVDAMNKLLQ